MPSIVKVFGLEPSLTVSPELETKPVEKIIIERVETGIERVDKMLNRVSKRKSI